MIIIQPDFIYLAAMRLDKMTHKYDKQYKTL